MIRKLVTNLKKVSEFKQYFSDKFVIHGDIYSLDKLISFFVIFLTLQQLNFIKVIRLFKQIHISKHVLLIQNERNHTR